MRDSDCPTMADVPGLPLVEPGVSEAAERLRRLVDAHYDFVWRTLRYLGLGDADSEDAAQQVMCVLARRLGDVRPGAERPFLFSTATNVAATYRRTLSRRPEMPTDEIDALAAPTPNGEELLDARRAREMLDTILRSMPVELRLVFVLHEIEELTAPEIAEMIGVPVGTVASRLRRGRATFHSIVQRVLAAKQTRRGNP